MMLRILSAWNGLKASFWFIPMLFIALSLLGAVGAITLDAAVDLEPEGALRYLLPGDVDSARGVLSTISGAMIGVAGTVFSITLVALTLANSQFGSHLLRNFMHDRTNQVVLGSYISTFVYSLTVLNVIDDSGGDTFIPVVSVLVAMIAAVANIFLLIVFIHHIAMSIQADHVVSDVSSTLSKNLDTYFPEDGGEDSRVLSDEEVEGRRRGYLQKVDIGTLKDGYIQYIDYDALMAAAEDWGLLIDVRFRPGDHVVKGDRVLTVFSDEELADDAISMLQQIWIVGRTRTAYQDPEFSIHQMVEVALRALSPGINDPYTAMTCIDNLASAMCELTTVRFPSPHRFDGQGELRITADVLDFEGMLGAAFNQIRQNAEGSPSVIIRLMEALVTIGSFARNEEQRRAVRKHARMVLRSAERTIKEDSDLQDLKDRSALLLAGSQ